MQSKIKLKRGKRAEKNQSDQLKHFIVELIR